jgi:uncharacterized membrane protein YjgN (DUF898 family)
MRELAVPFETAMNQHLSEQLETEQGGKPFVLRYDGETGEIFVLSLGVGFLTIITLGIYRFWATTRVRRWFWSRITINGEPLEYSGTGFELFVAFIKVALVLALVLIPLKLAETFYDFRGITSFAQLLFVGLLYVLGGYYARRYRLTRTQWRGIRGNLVGSPLDYLKLNVGYLLLTAVTLGVAYPYYRVATRRYLFDHTWFGDQNFHCTAQTRSLMGRWLIYFAVSLLLLGLIGLQLRELALAEKGSISPATVMATVAALVGVGVVLGAFFIAYRTTEFGVLAASLTFQGVRVASNLSGGQMLLFALKVCGAAVLCIILLGVSFAILGVVLFSGLAALIKANAGQVSPAMILPFALLALPPLLAISVFFRTYYHVLLRRVVKSLSFEGALDPASIGQTRQTVPRWGEGIFGAFDTAG